MARFASQISSVLLFLLFTRSLNRVMSCNENDERLLLIFKQGVVDPDNKLSSWTSEEDCCLWEVVHCDITTGRATELSLFTHSLEEKFFAGLSSLTTLGLSSNSFKSDFDPKWVPSFQLETLYMANTSIGPNVPPWLYTQQSLRELNISGSGISTIDKDIFWNFVAGIEYVDISNNLISDDISGVTLSANVSYFYASHTSLSGSVFSLLCQLEGNGESKLVELDLSYNHLSGALPDCWTNRKSLEFLSLGSNKLIGKVPPSFASLGLEQLDLSDNSFSSEFSSSMLNWTNLRFLILEKNNFSGSLPNPYMARSLEVLKLRTNQFMGNIPPGICMLSSLRILELADNKLFGSIPSCLCNITNPNNISSYFDLREMMRIFTKGRELDYQFARYFRSSVIDLSGNSLSGEIPKELFSITLMWSLNLSRNHLTGKIPKEIGALKNLESLDLSHNRLSGEIPSTISNLSFLACLNLSYNNLIGQIPLGTQIQGFDTWSFVGNHELCGDPLPKKCNKKDETHDDSKPPEGDEDDGFLKSMYLGMGVGFAAAFWGICGSLFLIRAWRHRFFRWFDHLTDQLYVAFTLWFKRFG
ncbi:receptor-like protein EIX2 [Neltuma alba]|uniref:receptor-like protein EIX2 n=1 Tax=Neltuma alba TaxID=207710 RepID=UPI0010A47C9F|nr:receptor-like protein EIX2 [Prosopis alba]